MTATPAPPRPFRRAHRDSDTPLIGGVASGLAEHLAVPVVWLRVAFVVSAVLGGLGVGLYLGLWFFLPAGHHFDQDAPGVESASRGGRRPVRGRLGRLGDTGPVVVLAVICLGVVFAFTAVFGRAAVLWPLVIGLVGLGLLWRQADEAQRERWLDASGRIDPVRIVLGNGGWAAWARLGAGAALVALSIGLLALRGGSVTVARDVTIAALLGVVGLAIVLGPWIVRLVTDLGDERSERVRTQERADVAAHLHDSVLQTLALIQKNADDAGAVARLARAQERDLRSWLFTGENPGQGGDAGLTTLTGALRAVAAEVEDAHGVTVDVVSVGDCDYDASLLPLVAAARESLVNAAKHAGVPRVDVYAEVGRGAVDVFVRDRGVGFDPETVADDRHGVRDSIVGRMARHGGRAEIRSAVGEGVEVRLRLPREEVPGNEQ